MEIQQKSTSKLKKLLVSSRQWVGAAETMICQQSSVLSIHLAVLWDKNLASNLVASV
jgi:hypothetical protein